MSKIDIDALRERLTTHLADWGTEMSSLLKELGDARAELDAAEASSDDHDGELKVLEDRVKGQSELIETLKAEVEDMELLRSEVRNKDLEIERLSSELESKQELVRALRRDAESVERLKAAAKSRDSEIERLKRDLDSAVGARELAEQDAATLREELAALTESADSESSGEHAELEAVRAELEARKSLIQSLRADAERFSDLESLLQEKRAIIGTLEASINRHSETITSLKHDADAWKCKYQALKNGTAGAASTRPPQFSDTDLTALEQLDKVQDTEGGQTIAIDMRQPLREARRKATETRQKR